MLYSSLLESGGFGEWCVISHRIIPETVQRKQRIDDMKLPYWSNKKKTLPPEFIVSKDVTKRFTYNVFRLLYWVHDGHDTGIHDTGFMMLDSPYWGSGYWVHDNMKLKTSRDNIFVIRILTIYFLV